MKRPNRQKLIIVAIVALIAGLVVLWLKKQLDIDACLDHGGAWSYEQGKCEGARSR